MIIKIIKFKVKTANNKNILFKKYLFKYLNYNF